MITAAQLRAARGLLDWTRNELAEAAKVSPETVKNIEHGVFRPQEQTAEAIVRAFAMHDVEFTDGEGVRISKELVKTYAGSEEFKNFFDEMYETVKKDNAEICICGVDDSLFVKHLGDHADIHVQRMTELKSVKVRCLIREGDSNVYCSSYNEYRWIPAELFGSVPFYVYGDRFAVVVFDGDKVSVVVIVSKPVASAYRKQFEIIWKDAKTVSLVKRAK